jgi:recombination protein RecA
MIDELIKKLNEGGKLTVMALGDEDSPCVVTEWIPTGCLALDWIMGGGLPAGRIVEIYGDTSTGKTLVATMAVITVQMLGGIVLYVDTESAVSIDLMEELGVNVDELLYSVPDTMEETFLAMERFIDEASKRYPEKIILIVWDSIAATSTNREVLSDVGTATVGEHARLISQGMRKITRQIAKKKVAALFLNQTREKIGVMFGDNEATFGGKAVPFYSSVRVRLKKGPKISEKGNKDKIIGIGAEAQVVKNKVAVPFRKAYMPIYFGYGVDDAEATLELLKALDLVAVNGGWYTLQLGKDELRFQKKEWSDLYEKHEEAIRKLVFQQGD